MSTGFVPASGKVVEGTVRYPPSLGFERAADGRMRARLANTLSTTSGDDVTVVFRGDRAEVAERLLVRGSRLGVVGVWDQDRQELLVEQFDVAGSEDDHPYRLGGRPAAELAADVDVSRLYEMGAVSVWPEGLPPPPSEEFTLAEGQVRRGQPASPVRLPADDGGGEVPAGARFAPGQRVVAGDRGNVGTVVSVDPTGYQVRVRFVSPGGTTAVVGFASTELTLARRQQAPRRDQAHRAAGVNTDSPRPQIAPRDDAHTVGPPPAASVEGRAVEMPAAGEEASGGPQGQHRSGVMPSGEEVARGGVDVPLGISPLRVHTRRPGPTGEIQL